MKRALVLFAHGARAQSWAAPFERLRDQSQARLPEVRVTLAFLELMEPRLPEAVAALVQEGVDDITIVPVFLGQGGHLLRDLPQLADGIRTAHPGLRLQVAGAIGEDPGVQAAMTDYCIRSLG
ncbi:sirohydrochlorin chelatase [Massilia sp. 9I]|uniref:sirohydrochlorin chelatase n=1 Tax=Massilia sp. 9I TaxID=2653152 RepID=UPI0012F09343|nr:CbiX/SirB N-terminal domain-containing protein [Massilia sp. 9I]VXB17944.1 Sirohydrochlorin cobaltochelatase [Massilia sp. 9I]